MKTGIGVFLGIPLFVGILSCLFHPTPASWSAPEPLDGEILIEKLKSTSDPRQVIWVDARSEARYVKQHVPQAILLNFDSFEMNLPILLERWSPGKMIVVYCDTQLCNDSHDIAQRLESEIGLSDVWVLHGGWTEWKKHNL